MSSITADEYRTAAKVDRHHGGQSAAQFYEDNARALESEDLVTQVAMQFAGSTWGGRDAEEQFALAGSERALAYMVGAGRLIPDGGMALTAEQVEDVRALVWLDGRRNFDAFHRLRALFPATEPAEDAPCAGGDCFDVCEGHPAPAEPAEAHCTVPPEGWWCSRAANHDGPCAASEGVAPWVPQPLEADWLDQVDPRDPQSRTHRETAAAKFAEPAEEETKAEAIEALTEAIRFTVEYVWLNTLPPIEGWSWYDALLKYAPEKAKAFLDAYTPPVNPSPAEHVTTETGQRIVNTTVLTEVADERARQDAKWGEQNHPDVDHVLMTREGGASPARMAEHYELPTAGRAKFLCDQAADFGQVTYAHILIEEVAEVVEAATRASVTELRAELIQVAAVAVAWVEKLDREAASSPVVPAPTETEAGHA